MNLRVIPRLSLFTKYIYSWSSNSLGCNIARTLSFSKKIQGTFFITVWMVWQVPFPSKACCQFLADFPIEEMSLFCFQINSGHSSPYRALQWEVLYKYLNYGSLMTVTPQSSNSTLWLISDYEIFCMLLARHKR